MHPTVEPDRLEAHGKRGNVKPVTLFDDFGAKQETDSTAASNGDVLAIGNGDKHVRDGLVGDKVRAKGGHTERGTGIDAHKAGFRGRRGSLFSVGH